MIEILVSQRQIFHRCQQASRAHGIEIRYAQAVAVPAFAGHVTIRDVLHNLRMVVTEVRGLHIERPEDAIGRELPE